MEIELGDKVKDLVTGFEGIAVAKTEFINGCVQFSVVRQLKKNEKMLENPLGDPSIDSKSLKIIKKRAVDLRTEEEKETENGKHKISGYWDTPKKKRKKRKNTGGPTTLQRRMKGY